MSRLDLENWHFSPFSDKANDSYKKNNGRLINKSKSHFHSRKVFYCVNSILPVRVLEQENFCTPDILFLLTKNTIYVYYILI